MPQFTSTEAAAAAFTSLQDAASRALLRRLELELDQLELLISSTPTGPKRNRLTEANIHLHAARDAMRRADDAPRART